MRNLPGVGLHPPQRLAAADPAVCEESIGKAAAPREAYRLPPPCTGPATAVHSGRGGGCVLLPCVSSASAAPLAAGQSHESGVRREGRTGRDGTRWAGGESHSRRLGRGPDRGGTAPAPHGPGTCPAFPCAAGRCCRSEGNPWPASVKALSASRPRQRQRERSAGQSRGPRRPFSWEGLGEGSGNGFRRRFWEHRVSAVREDRFRTPPVAFPEARAAPQRPRRRSGADGARTRAPPRPRRPSRPAPPPPADTKPLRRRMGAGLGFAAVCCLNV